MTACVECNCEQGHHLYWCPEVLKSKTEALGKGIASFTGKNRWLSNFWLTSVEFEGVRYPSSEHAYQAAKTLDLAQREEIRVSGSPGNAKRLGTKVTLRPDWEEIKLGVMEGVLVQKFSEETPLHEMLKETTGDLKEGNWWHDNFWGSCACEKCGDKGQNHLGKILMRIRSTL